MKLTRSSIAHAVTYAFLISAILISQVHTGSAQNSNGALQRGYRTGYSDGYMAGYRDSIDSLAKSINRHNEYQAADRAFSKDYGTVEDYRDGYRQGFEIGYETGFEKKTFESTVPSTLGKRGLNSATTQSKIEPRTNEPVRTQTNTIKQEQIVETVTENRSTNNDPPITTTQGSEAIVDQQPVIQKANFSSSEATLLIPQDTEIVMALQEDLSTELTRQGERFTARVVSPMELDGAIVEGRVEKIQIPGRLKRTAEMQLTFDRIVLNDKRWSNFSGILTEVIAIKGDNVRRITDEGTAIGQSSIKSDAIKVGGATGAGAGIGALVGGPVGAAVGAGVGAAFGIGSAVIDRGKHIRLNKNQQLRVRTSYETQIK